MKSIGDIVRRYPWSVFGCGAAALLVAGVAFSSLLDPAQQQMSPGAGETAAMNSPLPTREMAAGIGATAVTGEPRSILGESAEEAAHQLAYFKDARIPLAQRRARLTQLARSLEPESYELLMAVGDAHTYLNWAAIEALGMRPNPKVTEYLRTKLNDPNHQIIRAAIGSYASVAGDDGAAHLVEVLQSNRVRADGYEEEICSDIVKALGEMKSTLAVAALVEELRRYDEAGWSLEYGSVVVTALAKIGTAEAHQGRLEYADALARTLPQDPLASRYFQEKIEQARLASVGTP